MRKIGILSVFFLLASASMAGATMSQFMSYTDNGAGMSVDAKGLADNTLGVISADIPVGASVYKAFLYSAAVGYSGNPLVDVVFEGNTLTSDVASRLDVGARDGNSWVSENRWDVTSIVQAKVGSGSGLFSFDLTETGYLDGEVLTVLYYDTTKPVNTAIIYDGELATTGDFFNIALTTPVDKTNPNFFATMSLGISYSFQFGGGDVTGQWSQVDVNGQRMTSSAGGEDDGFSANGGLITAGGIGDSIALPASAIANGGSARYDDELYGIESFLSNGETLISIRTLNPSNDDNVFFLGFTTLGEAKDVSTVPEPATLLMLGAGLLGLAGAKRKLRN